MDSLALTDSIPINLFIKLRLDIFLLRPMLSFTFVPWSLFPYLWKVSGCSRKVLFSVGLGENFHLMVPV